MCLCVFIFLFLLFFAFLSPKYLFFFKKVVLVRCWEKYRPLIDLRLFQWNAGPPLGIGIFWTSGGNPIPTVSTLAPGLGGWGGGAALLSARPVGTRGQDTHFKASLQKGLRERERERVEVSRKTPGFTSLPVLSYHARLTQIPQWEFTRLPLKLYFLTPVCLHFATPESLSV